MKNAIHQMLATMLFLVLSIPAALANNPIGDEANGLIVKVAPSEKGRAIELRMANLQNQFTKVKILDVWGFGLLSQHVDKQDGYSSLLQLNELPSGDYLLRIEHPSGVFHHAFRLGIESVAFFDSFGKNEGFVKLASSTAVAHSLPAHFTTTKNILGVSLQGLEGSLVQVHVCNMAGKVYLKEKFKAVRSLDEQFATDKLPSGEFMIVVRSNDQTFIQPFVKTDDGLKLNNTLTSKPLQTNNMEIYSKQ